jgi:hypothetical protein
MFILHRSMSLNFLTSGGVYRYPNSTLDKELAWE